MVKRDTHIIEQKMFVKIRPDFREMKQNKINTEFSVKFDGNRKFLLEHGQFRTILYKQETFTSAGTDTF